MRVFKLAKKIGITSKELIQELNKMGVAIKNHMSMVEDSCVDSILNKFNKKKEDVSEGAVKAAKKTRILIKKKPAKIEEEPKIEAKAEEENEIQPHIEIHKEEGITEKREIEKRDIEEKSVIKEPSPEPLTKTEDIKTKLAEKPPVTINKEALKLKEEEKEKVKKGKKLKHIKREDFFSYRQETKRWQLRTHQKNAHKKNDLTNVTDLIKPRKKTIKIHEGLTVKEFSETIGQKSKEVMSKLMEMGTFTTVNHPINIDAALLIANNFGLKAEVVQEKTEEELLDIKDDPSSLLPRSPVVTIMGHVDHGKTSLLDVIRKTRVTDLEAGGITQHIGAYTVNVNNKMVVFLDTPGHEAFTAMRSRGARITDIVILVVAADDGVMPQTIEAINHSKAANVPIIVAINKIDKPNANAERVKHTLSEYDLVQEEWGGDTIFCEVSAKQQRGLDNLIEMILLQAEVMELKASYDRPAVGTIIEAKLDKARGPVSTVLVQRGTLTIGDVFVTGFCDGRVRALINDKGEKIKEAGPSTPVEVIGLSGVPHAGDSFVVVKDERVAKEIANSRMHRQRIIELSKRKKITLDDLYLQIKDGVINELNIIIKTDVQGSIEAIRDGLEKMKSNFVKLKIIHCGVGGITESDVLLADASNAIIIGFNVRPENKAQKLAEKESVDIRLYTIIYNVIKDVKKAMEGLLEPTLKERVLGRVEVRETFNISRIGTIAGVYVLDGVISKNSARIIRDNIVIHEGRIAGLKRFKDDVKEVDTGYECGISMENYNDIKVGDIVEVYTFDKVAGKL
ncbi:MAG: translation initiation factor IF-2 [Nitrospirota bacterium]